MNHPELVVERVRHVLKVRQLTVIRVETVAGLLLRVTLAGDALRDFVSDSFDDHVKLLFPAVPGAELVLPEVGANGLQFPEGALRPVARDYTPRRYDPVRGELDIEFVLHGHGPASDWAVQAQPGQTLAIAGPRGSFVVPTEFDWHVLMGDETALPAIARRLEELPAGVQAIVRVEIPAAAHRLPLTSRAVLDLQWLYRDGAQPGDTGLLADAASQLRLPGGEGYVWVAAEASVARAVREILVSRHGIGKRRIRASSYWKRGSAGVHETIED